MGVFTDGDLRRYVNENGKFFLDKYLKVLDFKMQLTVDGNALLYQAVELFKTHKVDNLIVTDHNKVIGMIDVQDLIAQNLIG